MKDMKLITIVLAILLGLPFAGKAQVKPVAQSPVHWSFIVQKKKNGEYRFEAHAIMDKGFHIWALDAGGDGSLIPTSFVSESISKGGTWTSDWKELAPPTVQTLSFIEGAVRWHQKEITFYRDFKAPAGTRIKGGVEFQTCNEEMCYPPATELFEATAP